MVVRPLSTRKKENEKMKQVPKLISKTRLMRSYQCPKSFFLNIHHRDLEPATSEEQQAIFDQGARVGIEARHYFPDGVLVDNLPWDFVGSLKRTKELLAAQTKIIYEAAFEHRGCYARVDVLKYNEFSARWILYEVKSGTKIKEEYLDDISLQAWILAQSGLPIEQINLMHINPECRFPNLQNLFVIEDVTAKVRERYLKIAPHMTSMFNLIRSDEVPKVDIGPHCHKPNPCPFVEHCFSEKKIPSASVFDLPKIAERKWELYQQGIVSLDDERLEGLSDLQQRIVQVQKDGKRFVDKNGIKQSLEQWKFPLLFLDFETINPAIPRYVGAAPYQQVPFQFSVLRIDKLNDEPKVINFLHAERSKNSDPRPRLIEELLRACEGAGSIVAYYSKFEADRIQEMAEQFPNHKEALLSLVEKLVDPLPVIRDHVYDKEFAFSFSLKKVAPALLGSEHSYTGMTVDDGLAAQRAFEDLISADLPQQDWENLKQAMIEYCEKDTMMMLYLVRWMYQQCEA